MHFSKISICFKLLRILNNNYLLKILSNISPKTFALDNVKHLLLLSIVAFKTILAAKSEKTLSLLKTYVINN
jgi:hypothetical protein